MSIVYRKVARDLLRNKTRTLLVVLSTAVGVLALGIAVGGGDLMDAYITSEWQSFQPAHIVLSLSGAVGDDVAIALARAPGVGGVEPVIGSSIRWKRPGETRWRPGNLIARQDYKRQQQSLVRLLDGTWPGAVRGALAAERGTAEEFNLPPGSEIILQVGNTEREMRIAGVVHDLGTLPPKSGGRPEFFIASQAAQDLLGLNGYNQLLVRLPQFDRDRAYAVGDRLKGQLERMGLTVNTPFVQDPKKNWVVTQYTEPIMVILTVLGTLSLLLSAFLVINTINAVLAQQVSQIGVMKAFGATPGQVLRVYLVMVLAYGLMATGMAVIPTPFLARALMGTLLSMANMDLPPFQVAPGAIMLQLAVGCLAPVVAALWPVLSGTRITVRQAISSYGLGTDFGGGPLDQLVAHIRGLPRPLAISLRNTFRRKGRMALTQITLVIAGVMFISVMGVRDSLTYTLERFFASRGFSVYFDLQDPQRFGRAEAMAKSVPGVTRAEVWNVRPVAFDLGRHRLNVLIWAVPEDTTMFKPEIVAGRWLRPGDGNVIVLNQKIAADEGLKVGDQVTLKLERGDSTWGIVGLVADISNEQRTAYASRQALGRALHQLGRGTRLNVTADQNDLASLTLIEKQLRATFESNSITVNDSANIEQIRQQNMNQFGVVIYLLLAMSVLAGAVGGLGLMGTMSINVLERSKEIGVMRAIGASSSTLVGIFVVEGVIVGLLSAAIAIPFSIPGAWLFAQAVGQAMLLKMDLAYSTVGLLLWLLMVVALSSLASLWPAMRAARVSVRETLTYE